MIIFLKMIPGILGIINYFIKRAHERGLLDQGYQNAINDQMENLARSMRTVREISTRVDAATTDIDDTEFNRLLKRFEIEEQTAKEELRSHSVLSDHERSGNADPDPHQNQQSQ